MNNWLIISHGLKEEGGEKCAYKGTAVINLDKLQLSFLIMIGITCNVQSSYNWKNLKTMCIELHKTV